MRRNPLYVFKDQTSVGVFEVPLKSTIHILDYDGTGTPLFIQLVAKTGLNPASTIGELIANPALYIDISRALENYSELEKITENGKTGWRILGRNPDDYVYIGEEAFDFTYSDSNQDNYGARGDYSFTEGVQCLASGVASHAGGLLTSAVGDNSMTFGEGTIAQNESSVAFGKFNTGTSLDTLMEIGNGISPNSGNRSNALEVYTDGTIVAPSVTIADITNRGNKTLVTREYLFTNSSISELEKISEGGNTGWRILGRDATNYGDIGQDAIDFSLSETPSIDFGATGPKSFAINTEVISSGEHSFASGYQTEANGVSAASFGVGTTADGNYSIAAGIETTALGNGSIANGNNTISQGEFSHAEGLFTEARGSYSYAGGYNTIAIGVGASTGGRGTIAQNDYMVAIGQYNLGTNVNSIFEIGIGTNDTNRSNAFEIYADGAIIAPNLTNTIIHNNGNQTIVTKEYVDIQVGGASQLEKITENGNTGWRLLGRNASLVGSIGQDAIDLGYSDNSLEVYGAVGDRSLTEGYNNLAQGENSHTEGKNNKSIGINSHSEGDGNTASGNNSHAEGLGTEARATNSHTSGEGTIAQNTAQTSIGKYNVGLSNETIFEVGIGTNTSNRVNAFEIYEDGTVTLPAVTTIDIDNRGSQSLITKEYIDLYLTVASELEKITEGGKTGWRILGRDPDNYGDIGQNAIDFSYNTTASVVHGATGLRSFAEGHATIAYGTSSHAEGRETMANGIYSHAEGFYTNAVGQVTHTEGYQTVANGDWSHAEGVQTRTDGPVAHAEGWQTRADGERSHSEGANTRAEGDHSHAQGTETHAIGYSSETSGLGTIAQNSAQTSVGQYNIGAVVDTIYEVGIGIDDTNRANAFEIYTDGRIHAPELTTALITDARCLVTKEYADALGSGGVSAIDDLTDVDTTSNTPANGQVLKWDGTNWVPTDDENTDTTYTNGTGLSLTGTTFALDATVNNLSDVDTVTNTPANGQVLKWDGTNWVPADDETLSTKYDFDATAGQTDFIITNKVISEIDAYINGLKQRVTTYSITDDGTDTTITFNTAMSGGEWVSIEV